MNQIKLSETIREIIQSVFQENETATTEKYLGQRISKIYDVSFYDEGRPWISFNLNGDEFQGVPEEESHRIYEFDEDNFSDWIERTQDVSDYISSEADYDPHTQSHTEYNGFDYSKWKEYNNPEEYSTEFLDSEFKRIGMVPSPEFMSR